MRLVFPLVAYVVYVADVMTRTAAAAFGVFCWLEVMDFDLFLSFLCLLLFSLHISFPCLLFVLCQ